MPPDLKLVIRLQEIDNQLADLTREITALPKHTAEIERKLVAHERKLEADRAALIGNQKERKKCEAEIQTQNSGDSYQWSYTEDQFLYNGQPVPQTSTATLSSAE